MQAVVELPALKTKIKGKSYLWNCSATSVRRDGGVKQDILVLSFWRKSQRFKRQP